MSFFRYLFMFVLLLLISCSEIPITPLPTVSVETATRIPTQTVTPALTPTPSAIYNQWETLETGLEWYHKKNADHELFLLRVDPAYFSAEVGYSAGQLQLLSNWLGSDRGVAVINAGYFMENLHATGLTIQDGEVTGWNYDFGGMVAINDGIATVRSNVTQPYTDGEPIEDAMQSFPMLVENGVAIPQETEDYERRSAIGVDAEGRLVLIQSPYPTYSWQALADELTSAEYNLQAVLNLDGGASSGFLFRDYPKLGAPALRGVPQVIYIRPR